MRRLSAFSFFFFNDTATTEIYTLSLHDALPIFHVSDPVAVVRRYFSIALDVSGEHGAVHVGTCAAGDGRVCFLEHADRKSTRLNSSHSQISYAVFCLKKKKHAQHMNQSHYDVCI